jgi:hypothetical protein
VINLDANSNEKTNFSKQTKSSPKGKGKQGSSKGKQTAAGAAGTRT